MGDEQKAPSGNFVESFELGHEVTWREFRDAIDKMLTEHNVSQDIPIWYIDVSFPDGFSAGVEGGVLFSWR